MVEALERRRHIALFVMPLAVVLAVLPAARAAGTVGLESCFLSEINMLSSAAQCAGRHII